MDGFGGFREVKNVLILALRNIAGERSLSNWHYVPRTSRVRLESGSRVREACIEDYVSVTRMRGSLEKLFIGKCSYSGIITAVGLKGSLTIGRYCSIGSEVFFICGDGYHQSRRMSTYPFPFSPPFKNISTEELYHDSTFPKAGIVIGNDVWIGSRTTITKGVNVGNGAVIALDSVVTGDVPPYAIVAGNPAEIKKYRHDDETIELLERIKWWEWSVEDIMRNIDLFKTTGNDLKKRLMNFLKDGTVMTI